MSAGITKAASSVIQKLNFDDVEHDNNSSDVITVTAQTAFENLNGNYQNLNILLPELIAVIIEYFPVDTHAYASIQPDAQAKFDDALLKNASSQLEQWEAELKADANADFKKECYDGFQQIDESIGRLTGLLTLNLPADALVPSLRYASMTGIPTQALALSTSPIEASQAILKLATTVQRYACLQRIFSAIEVLTSPRLEIHSPQNVQQEIIWQLRQATVVELASRVDHAVRNSGTHAGSAVVVRNEEHNPQNRPNLAKFTMIPSALIAHCSQNRTARLNLFGNHITDITPLSHLAHVSSLQICRNKISDLSPLVKLPELQELSVYGNPVTSFAPFFKVPKLQTITISLCQFLKFAYDLRLLLQVRPDIKLRIWVSNEARNVFMTQANRLFIQHIVESQPDKAICVVSPNGKVFYSTNSFFSIIKAHGMLPEIYTHTKTAQTIIGMCYSIEGLQKQCLDLNFQSNSYAEWAEKLINHLHTDRVDVNPHEVWHFCDIGMDSVPQKMMPFLATRTKLDFSDNQITDFSFLAGLPGLTALGIDNNPIASIRPLFGLKHLTTILISEQQLRMFMDDWLILLAMRRELNMKLSVTHESFATFCRSAKSRDIEQLGKEDITDGQYVMVYASEEEVAYFTPNDVFEMLTEMVAVENKLSAEALQRLLLNMGETSSILNIISQIPQFRSIFARFHLESQDVNQAINLFMNYLSSVDLTNIFGEHKEFNLTRCDLTDLPKRLLPLFQQVYTLNLDSNRIVDIEIFKRMPNLHDVVLWHNPIADFTPLKYLKLRQLGISLEQLHAHGDFFRFLYTQNPDMRLLLSISEPAANWVNGGQSDMQFMPYMGIHEHEFIRCVFSDDTQYLCDAASVLRL